MSDDYRIELLNFSKSFPGVKALDDVTLKVKPASIHALVGENGAGKSTLMNCLFGLYSLDKGEIKIDGEHIDITSPSDALASGIAMIHQELNPIMARSVSDNIWLGRYDVKMKFVIDRTKIYQKTEDLIKSLDFDINPDALMKDLSISELQAIEIVKAVSYDSKVVVMDEPTSSLTNKETEHLFKIIRKLKESGVSVIYISHKLEEIFSIVDEVSIMRDGQMVGTWPIEEMTMSSIITNMVGRTLDQRFPPKVTESSKEILLRVKNFSSDNPRSFQNVDFDLRKGEILGIGGLVGAQRTELVESIFGLRQITSGSLEYNGKEISIKNTYQAIKNGFALLTEDRRGSGIFPVLSILDNTLTVCWKKHAKTLLRIVDKSESRKAASDISEKMNVRMTSLDAKIKDLSGGNQQKVLIGRWLLADSNILVLDEPTRGIDVGAKYEIYKLMRELTALGNSIIMVSSEMPELIAMSDRIVVMCAGKVTGILDSEEEFDQADVLSLATKF